MGPIEPAASTAAASLLARGSAPGGGQPAIPELGALVEAMLGHHRGLQDALERARAQPEDPTRVGALAQALTVLGETDPAFGHKLTTLVAQARQAAGVGGLVTRVYGHAQVGKLVTIGQAGDIHLHLPLTPTVLDQLPRTQPGPLVANLPPRNPAFTGREDLLERLHASLRPGQPTAVVQAQAQTLHGLGGVGKTQLALEYAYRHQADYDLIWWVNADQSAAIPGQLVALAHRLGIPDQQDHTETIQALWDALRSRDRWLLVFDNAEDPNDLRTSWPPDSGQVLITSRAPTWTGLTAALAVDVLPRAEAVAFLHRRGGLGFQEAAALAEVLGDLPLALEQAAAYLEETAISTSEYLDLLGEHARELFALGRPASTEHTIATTWLVALQRLRDHAPAAEDLLILCAFLAAEDIPRTLPVEHPDVLPGRLAAVAARPLAYQQTIGALRRYSLVKTSQHGTQLSVHRLVQAVVRHGLDRSEQQRWAEVAVRLLFAAFPVDSYELESWPTCVRLLPHALTVVQYASAFGVEPTKTVVLLNRVGDYLWGQGELRQVKALLEQASDIALTHLGSDHLEVARTLKNLGTVVYDLGDLPSARIAIERALAIREARLGPDHPEVAYNLNNLGLVLRDLGDLAGARAAHERALVIREAQLGPNDTLVAQSLNSLGSVLADLGDLTAARSTVERGLRIREACYGPRHFDVAYSLNTLARVLRNLGDLAQARTVVERALDIYETQFGPDHPYVGQSLYILGLVKSDLGDLLGSRAAHERALTIREARLGPDHPDTVRSREALAAVVAEFDDQP